MEGVVCINSFKNSYFYTPKGLKIRFNRKHINEYITENDLKSWYISIEAFDYLRVLLTIVFTIYFIVTDMNNYLLSTSLILTAYLSGYMISQSYYGMILINIPYGLFFIAYSIIDKFYIPYIVIIVLAILNDGVFIVLSMVVARIIGFLLVKLINYFRSSYLFSKTGLILTDIEVTAAKLIKFYSMQRITYKEWLGYYARVIKDN